MPGSVDTDPLAGRDGIERDFARAATVIAVWPRAASMDDQAVFAGVAATPHALLSTI